MQNVRRFEITGKVQGVGYRAWFREEAEALGLRGWVRNRRDGSVEAEVCGADDALTAIERAAHQGPAFAHVTRVRTTPIARAEAMPDVMEVRPTL
ncbi:acylphosphatase [Agaricicola taiwanensis]|uniref:acylphosphatase n=1 Tax=Agaricicola taiwanensis TaxID=591372 RepID=A0A8J2YJ67_9RHOB|nr:acylphosphatase [Agaricicola taiwanensis]GGE46686.1 acylphosphatase [Agaricicola taiwanensis]